MAENPKSLSGATMGMAADGSSLAVVDHDGGRPPDIILLRVVGLTNGVKDFIWSLIHKYRGIKLSSGVRSLLAVVSSRTPHEKILPRDRSDQLIIWATADILPLVTSADGGF
ncbi:hypothetical protein V6N13_093281 [Hibiscus sabdariffa]